MTIDKNVQAVRDVREKLIRRHGGLAGWIQHLVAMDQARMRTQQNARKKLKPRRLKSRAASHTRRRTSRKESRAGSSYSA